MGQIIINTLEDWMKAKDVASASTGLTFLELKISMNFFSNEILSWMNKK